MAKRGAESQLGRDPHGFTGDGSESAGEPSGMPQRATAAQLAKRK